MKYPVKSKIPHAFATTDTASFEGVGRVTLTPLNIETKTNVAGLLFEINSH